MSVLTQASPYKSKKQREQDVGPVPLMLSRHGNHPQEEEDECLGDGAEHLDHVADGRAGSLGNVLLHVVLHGQSAAHNPRTMTQSWVYFLFGTDARSPQSILRSTHAMMEEMAKSSATR